MIVAHCLEDLDELSNYDPLHFLRCCSIWWKIALIELFTCLHVMFCLLRSGLSYHKEIVKPAYGPKFAFSSITRVGLTNIRFDIAALLNLPTMIMKGN